MKEKLLQLLSVFGSGLTPFESNQYTPKIRDYFFRYILAMKPDSSIENLFKYELTRNDLINSTIYYIMVNDHVRSKSAIDDYLIAVNRFFDETLFNLYPNQNLVSIRPFTSLSKEIEKILIERKVELEERQTFPSINDEQYRFILSFINNDLEGSFKTKQVQIIIKLILLYGLSPERIIKLKKGSYLMDERQLEVIYSENPRRSLVLEIPFKLHKEIEAYLDELSTKKLSCDNFFVNREDKSIKHNYPNSYLKEIKKEYFAKHPIEEGNKNSFTPTGLAKFAIIRMILNGVNPSVISDLTGYMSDVLTDCQNKVNEMKGLNRNRYINHMIRGIQTYEEI
ncbi:site-specific integrase [Paenibacillus agilis]|uniref:Site-specific integrase n=1 Tax=Paenibacillus agilis TaxID=3020863 RepID=A0A559J2L5_9BACL|nr:site-specific integrase [Paenibacillus agilis]TVX94124.1 site-specific integrase [Paenibacillus agilis]